MNVKPNYSIFEMLLEENGITAYKVAQDTGIETSTLTSWKKGTYAPKLEKLLKIADYFGVSVGCFLGNTDESFQKSKYTKIKELCREKDVSVDSVEKELGFARGSLCKIDSHAPSISRLQKLADYFGVSMDYFMDGVDSRSDSYRKYERLRDELGILNTDVSKATGIPCSTFSDWKKGKSKPKIEKLSKLADYFNVPVSYFLDGDADEEMDLVEEGEIYMSDLQIFNNTEFGKIRTLLVNDEPYFVGKDVAKALGYGSGNSSSKALANAIKDHVDEDDKRMMPFEFFKGYQNGDLKDISHFGAYIINESGLYSLIFASKLPNAKKFKRWVTSEVLPALRKTGQYKMNDGMEESVEKEPQKKELDYLKAAEVIAGCDKTRLNTVLDLVRKAGFEVEEPRTFIPNIPQPVEQFLKGKTVEDVLNYTTRDLYLEFSTDLPYEIKNEIREADLEVYINVILGTRTVYRVVHGSSSKVFVM